MVDPNSGCWLWTASITPKGYGHISAGYSLKMAHRVSWELHKGAIPDGMLVCHKCDVRSCVNPDHLFLGTSADNTADMMAKGRHRPPAPVVGEKNHSAKLTQDQAIEILAAEETQTELAKKFNISQSLVSSIRTRQSWNHIDAEIISKAKEKNRAGFKSLSVADYCKMLSLLEMDER